MSSDELLMLDATDLAAAFRSRKLSPVEVMKASLARIAKTNGPLNAFVLVDEDGAMACARAAEEDFAKGRDTPPLAGIPISVKDNILTAGMRSTMGSPLFHDYVPERDSGVVRAARTAGAIVVGKTNTPAFGWTGTTDNMVFGPTRNPWNSELTCGGSSGGGAVAVAAGMVPISLGTDGGGSLRTPAAFSGVVGFKPSHGRFPDTPVHPHWLFQHYGPLTRSVRDVACVMDAAAGPDPEDPHSLPKRSRSYVGDLSLGANRPKVLFSAQLGWVERVEPEILAACREVARELEGLGWKVEERDLSWSDPSPFANVIQIVGLKHRLAAYQHRRDEIEPGIMAMLEAADALPPNAFYEAYFARNEWCVQPLRVFEEFDLLLTPATATLPFEIGKLAPERVAGEKVGPGAWNPFLRVFNITGQPAISIPVGRSASGLPIGLQIAGSREADALVLAAAAEIERLRPWQPWQPPD